MDLAERVWRQCIANPDFKWPVFDDVAVLRQLPLEQRSASDGRRVVELDDPHLLQVGRQCDVDGVGRIFSQRQALLRGGNLVVGSEVGGHGLADRSADTVLPVADESGGDLVPPLVHPRDVVGGGILRDGSDLIVEHKTTKLPERIDLSNPGSDDEMQSK